MTIETRVPASTSNLGAGFDCFGLALKLYLTVRATPGPDASEPCRVTTTGAPENEALPTNSTNLIYRAMSFAARRESISLPPLELISPQRNTTRQRPWQQCRRDRRRNQISLVNHWTRHPRSDHPKLRYGIRRSSRQCHRLVVRRLRRELCAQ